MLRAEVNMRAWEKIIIRINLQCLISLGCYEIFHQHDIEPAVLIYLEEQEKGNNEHRNAPRNAGHITKQTSILSHLFPHCLFQVEQK